jgi:hypothetical protein
MDGIGAGKFLDGINKINGIEGQTDAAGRGMKVAKRIFPAGFVFRARMFLPLN